MVNRDLNEELYKVFHLNTKQFPLRLSKVKEPIYSQSFHPKKIFKKEVVSLPELNLINNDLFNALVNRKSYSKLNIRIPIKLEDLSTLLQLSYLGRNKSSNQLLSVPSAGGFYSSSMYLIVFNILGIEAGVYYWDPFERHLALLKKGDYREELKEGIVLDLNKMQVENCTFAIILTSNLDSICSKYRDRGYRFALIDIGCISQNLYLASSYLQIATRAIGGYYDNLISKLIPNNNDEVMLVHLFGKEAENIKDQVNIDDTIYFK